MKRGFAGSSADFRQPSQGCLDVFVGVFVILQFAGKVSIVGCHVEMAVPRQIEQERPGLAGFRGQPFDAVLLVVTGNLTINIVKIHCSPFHCQSEDVGKTHTAVDELVNEIRGFYQTLVAIGNELQEGSGITMGMRTVLEFLNNNGDHTVPQIARVRRVTRQRIQNVVDRLMEAGLVATRDNPSSKRSPLITVTPQGKSAIQQMRKREMKYLSQVDFSLEEVETARNLIVRLRETLERVDT